MKITIFMNGFLCFYNQQQAVNGHLSGGPARHTYLVKKGFLLNDNNFIQNFIFYNFYMWSRKSQFYFRVSRKDSESQLYTTNNFHKEICDCHINANVFFFYLNIEHNNN